MEDIIDRIIDAQVAWVSEHYPQANVNYGWGTTETEVASKVYGFGILESKIVDGEVVHYFEPMCRLCGAPNPLPGAERPLGCCTGHPRDEWAAFDRRESQRAGR